ncbi:unnamed protein product, partial [Polarella glacialis]
MEKGYGGKQTGGSSYGKSKGPPAAYQGRPKGGESESSSSYGSGVPRAFSGGSKGAPAAFRSPTPKGGSAGSSYGYGGKAEESKGRDYGYGSKGDAGKSSSNYGYGGKGEESKGRDYGYGGKSHDDGKGSYKGDRGYDGGKPSYAPPAKALVEHGQQQYENTFPDSLQDMGANMCWIQEWFQESWPLENAQGSSSYNHLANQKGMRMDIIEEPEQPRPEAVLVFGDRVKASWKKPLRSASVMSSTSRYEYLDTAAGAVPDVERLKGLLSGRHWDLVVYGCGIDQPSDSSMAGVLSHMEDVSRLYLEIAKLVQQNKKNCRRLAVLTRDVFTDDAKKHSKAGVGLVASSPLWGMTNCIRLELEDVPVQYIDFEWKPSEAAIAQVASDLFCLETFGCNTLRILNDGRFVMRQVLSKAYEARQLPFQGPPSSGVIAVTGGNGSLAQVFALHLLELAEQKNRENPDLPPCSFRL